MCVFLLNNSKRTCFETKIFFLPTTYCAARRKNNANNELVPIGYNAIGGLFAAAQNVEVEKFGDPIVPEYEIPHHADIIESLNKKTNEYELLKIEYKKIEDENKYLNEKKEQLIIKNDDLNKEIKELKKEIMDQKKKSLMLKALIKIMIKNYGIENVSKVTNLSLDQIKKYLN